MKRVDVASALIFNSAGNMLVVKNRKGDSFYWGLPGGAVEEGETLMQAVVREVKEETGYDVSVMGLSSVRETYFQERGHHAIIFTFLASVIGGGMCVNDPDGDIMEVKWVDAEEAQKLMPLLYAKLRIGPGTDQAPAFYAFEGLQ